MEISDPIYTNADHTSINATIDGVTMSVPVCAGNRHYDEIIKQGLTIAEYVAPAVDTAAQRKAALARLDPLVCQIQRYKLLGEASSDAESRLAEAMEEINTQYPVS